MFVLSVAGPDDRWQVVRSEFAPPNRTGLVRHPVDLTVVDAEATAIRECAARVLSGESLASICRDPADRGITTTGGKKWLPTTIPVVQETSPSPR